MFKFNSISDIDGRTVVRLELDVSCTLSKSLIDGVNSACDCVEDAGAGATLLVLMNGAAPTAAETGAGTLNVTLVNQWERALRRIERLNAVTIAGASGPCGDLGIAVMLTTDYRIAGPGLNLSLRCRDGGILPGMVLHRLAHQVGVTWSRRFAVLGMPLDAALAQSLGLVDETADDPEAAATAFVKTLCPTISSDLAVRRRLLLDASALSYEEGLGTHLAACDRRLRSAVPPVLAAAPAAERAAPGYTN
ncbi:enoyl-CoA-hydratase DpgB [Duganella callida]|uniref:Enoyl-CoA hydratase/isomerase family protein n=1 Tax=Duganella callida TaxID=2561932 RepID=A0A4Y9SWV4_9BURK|nr:enoyl-CoA-hydratase DpgB [Duganella callida]TFW29133.1 enoyl-CoA hydratase/isomerase family protein [Duganella callida]